MKILQWHVPLCKLPIFRVRNKGDGGFWNRWHCSSCKRWKLMRTAGCGWQQGIELLGGLARAVCFPQASVRAFHIVHTVWTLYRSSGARVFWSVERVVESCCKREVVDRCHGHFLGWCISSLGCFTVFTWLNSPCIFTDLFEVSRTSEVSVCVASPFFYFFSLSNLMWVIV